MPQIAQAVTEVAESVLGPSLSRHFIKDEERLRRSAPVRRAAQPPPEGLPPYPRKDPQGPPGGSHRN